MGFPEKCEYDFKYAIRSSKNVLQIFQIQTECKVVLNAFSPHHTNLEHSKYIF